MGALVGMAGGLIVVFSVSALSSVAGMWFGAISSLAAFGIGYVASLFSSKPPAHTSALVVGESRRRMEAKVSSDVPAADPVR